MAVESVPCVLLLPLPDLVGENRELVDSWRQLHELFGWQLVIAIALHTALKHHSDDTLRRMSLRCS